MFHENAFTLPLSPSELCPAQDGALMIDGMHLPPTSYPLIMNLAKILAPRSMPSAICFLY
jgi:hypothetical protein